MSPIQATTILAATLLLAACDEKASETAQVLPRPVLVQHVAFENRTPTRTFVATIQPRVEAELGFRVGGKIAKRLVNVGDRVTVGQVLARVDDSDLQLQRQQAVAERDAAAASMVQAKADLRRTNTLTEKGWTAASSADRQQAVTEEANGRLLRAERALTLDQNAIDYATLMADADGVVTATAIEPGQVVTAGQLAVRLAHTAEREAVVAIPEASVAEARRGQASVSLWSAPGQVFNATLRELAPAADGATRTYLARYSLPGATPVVELGMTATLTLADRDTDRVARLPLSALFDQGSGPSVWLAAADGHLTLRPVTVLAYEMRDVLLRSGVSEGDAVVTLGVQKLDPGQQVRTVEALQF